MAKGGTVIQGCPRWPLRDAGSGQYGIRQKIPGRRPVAEGVSSAAEGTGCYDFNFIIVER